MTNRWTLTWTRPDARRTIKPDDALADPLENDDWRGLDWTVPIVVRILSLRRRAPPATRETRSVSPEPWAAERRPSGDAAPSAS